LIKEDAIKCRWCGSALTKKDIGFDFFTTPGYWHRVDEGKKVAGVCTGIAKQLDSPILLLPLRLFFILTTFFYGFGLICYIILWLLMPGPSDTPRGGKKSDDIEKKTPGSTDETQGSTRENEGRDSSDSASTGEVKMVGFAGNCGLLTIALTLFLFFYWFLLKHFVGIAVSPLVLFTTIVLGGILLTTTGIVLITTRRHANQLNVP
jgi:phage shock protein PspC (stress-responsive transcriptional regulator)